MKQDSQNVVVMHKIGLEVRFRYTIQCITLGFNILVNFQESIQICEAEGLRGSGR
jgi:hypothetical protein